MRVTKFDDAQRYETPGHFDMAGLRLQGHPASVTSGITVSLSYFLPAGGAERSGSDTEKIYVVLEGAVTIVTDDGEQTLGRLDSCHLAPGQARSIVNRTNAVATMLVIVVPKVAP
jgi:quercetin dioxygenase-like cupin family protein